MGFGVMDVIMPHEFIWLGAMDVNRHYKFICFFRCVLPAVVLCRDKIVHAVGYPGTPGSQGGNGALVVDSLDDYLAEGCGTGKFTVDSLIKVGSLLNSTKYCLKKSKCREEPPANVSPA